MYKCLKSEQLCYKMPLYNLFILSSILLSSGHAVDFYTNFELTSKPGSNPEKEKALRESFEKYFQENCTGFKMAAKNLTYDASVVKYLDYSWSKPFPLARTFYSFVSYYPVTSKSWPEIGKEHVNYITSYHRSGKKNETCQGKFLGDRDSNYWYWPGPPIL
ncbi:unnamed protein product [Cylicocyclus nassatus]|uniref:Uncharacterized protein n=1 Tax=Cylicocyclus nassatus TaxID=53992 RepID=A0AA36M4S1_CYLNA|nr:unnamed protein product [Cylicocyclus nassatus]